MRSEGNPLDLNNFPEDYTRDDAIQTSWDTSSSAGGGGGGYSKKKSGGGESAGKVYECRFCSLKFCKSQALGGHMNRHRQERETETLNKARHLVFTNDLAPAHLAYLGTSGQPIPRGGGYNQAATNNMTTIDDNAAASLQQSLRSMHTASSRMFPHIPPPASLPPHPLSFPSQYALSAPPPKDYYVGHVLSGNEQGAGGAWVFK